MPDWLEKAVFYEIYPQTFFDSNGDGIGDLPGILQKLEYLKYLGVNAAWLNPCFASPFQDAGYDVSDFYQVASRYGTNDDLHRLFDEARRLGIRIFLDLVAGHT
jgi:glycosidase